ncbi:periplasmic binding protein [Lawsonibacter asaccharolyticus]|nr:periplasmic binding protein [Lawsonibacter asaccharolyticus]
MGSSVSFTDSLGSTITLEEAPQRVAALIGSYAETWVLAGGRTRWQR